MAFRPVFIAVVIAFALIVSAFLINRARPRVETDQPSAAFVRASGKCAECHLQQQYSVVHEFEMSVHAQTGVNCLDCHQKADSQQEQGSPRLRDLDEVDSGQLPQLSRADLPGISPQPACRAVVGGGVRTGCAAPGTS
jgi:hypothetical protein